jgi:hypothetical protein
MYCVKLFLLFIGSLLKLDNKTLKVVTASLRLRKVTSPRAIKGRHGGCVYFSTSSQPWWSVMAVCQGQTPAALAPGKSPLLIAKGLGRRQRWSRQMWKKSFSSTRIRTQYHSPHSKLLLRLHYSRKAYGAVTEFCSIRCFYWILLNTALLLSSPQYGAVIEFSSIRCCYWNLLKGLRK